MPLLPLPLPPPMLCDEPPSHSVTPKRRVEMLLHDVAPCALIETVPAGHAVQLVVP